jgi:glyoxylase-like metal-dependent hydrolase (beta-lactamase superfamily II)
VGPGVLPTELDDIARVALGAEPLEVTLFLTHAHWDHVLGRAWWPRARTLAHDRFAGEVMTERAAIAREAEALAAKHGERWERGFAPFTPDTAVSGLRFMRLDPWRLVLRDAPGHSASAVTIHLPDHGVLVAGDLLSDVEIPGLDGPPAVYRDTIEGLWPLADGGAIETLVPGHGTIARGRDAVLARFEHDLGYLRSLEHAVREARAAGRGEEPTVEALATMEFTGKHGPYAEMLATVHAENVGHAWRAAAAKAPRRG